ncbi:MAG TPA: bifunctional methylenetetrahydrofolate dehydrogenase/methenyltetrahydrofolate cyclohydrolase [bacterium]|jgi:methylenetetrahydrofolate dehydrogenase (NADP+)/methenyltetrahydrofolate cyclohydrolase|nr:bifunctional methylenetetrahydrofolate dehydrogenase/methenyltetrahydrofolate cyclohydrolase [bacterium]
MNKLDPDILASFHRDDVAARIQAKGYALHVTGFLVSEDKSCQTYAEYTRARCEAVGLRFSLVTATQANVAELIKAANRDPGVHGIFVYYPIFGDARDSGIKDLVDPYKDVEGLCSHWMQKLYANERFDDPGRLHKCLLPCTPLAVLKLLEETEAHSEVGLPFSGQTVSLFNRSDVVGKPLAHMLANDGALVYSFDVDGGMAITRDDPSRQAVERSQALRESNVVITAVPSRHFEKIRADELRPGAVCINISSLQNFEEESKDKAGLYIPRVGPVTVAMCLRNALRLFEDHHLRPEAGHAPF